MANVIYEQRAVWARYLSADPNGKYFRLELFDEVLARVVRQKAEVSLPVTYQQNMLVQLCLHLFSSSQNSRGSLGVQTTITEIGTQLVSLRTQLLDFIQDDDTAGSANMSNTVAKFTNLGCFLSAITSDASRRPVYPLDDHDLCSLGQVGVELVLGILQVDNDFDIYEDLIRLKIFKVCITWFDENKEPLFKELCEEHDLYLCQHRLGSFLDSDWLEHADRESEYPVLTVKAEEIVLTILRNLEKKFGRQSVLTILQEYEEDWVEWVLSDLSE
ncbi:hypothetical protein INS49_001332 [Diaporthe citri]|uniref:uncharacterized protein n=1 Tax=Diaporthe citri TaxID=83186 RepID=UPI001C80C1DA|nr:uncharacterized protein INS49_001332 [Diaporthe citri]KAG6367149.1 hypothetical protein INS49_001332 [Diaporthe citri]